jgi:hypothetical protein
LAQDLSNRQNKESLDQDKYLPSILICPAYSAQSLRKGEHLLDLGQKMAIMNSDLWGKLKNNNNYRYHYLHGFMELNVPE